MLLSLQLPNVCPQAVTSPLDILGALTYMYNIPVSSGTIADADNTVLKSVIPVSEAR